MTNMERGLGQGDGRRGCDDQDVGNVDQNEFDAHDICQCGLDRATVNVDMTAEIELNGEVGNILRQATVGPSNSSDASDGILYVLVCESVGVLITMQGWEAK